MTTKAKIEQRWIEAWNGLFAIAGERKDIRCLLPDGSIVSLESGQGWLQDSAYLGYNLNVEPALLDGAKGVRLDRFLAIPDMVIVPHVSVGPIAFGMVPDEVHAAMGAPSKSYLKGSETLFLTDAYDVQGIHVFYNHDGMEAVEFYETPGPTLNGRILMGASYDETVAWLKSIDPEFQFEPQEGSAEARGIGISLGMRPYHEPGMPEPTVENCIVVRRGYLGYRTAD